MESLLIKNGEIVTAIDQYVADIYLEDGRIKAIDTDLGKSASRVIDASGHYVFPGSIDAHVHMELPLMGEVSSDDFETGTAAGLAGGTTTIIDFVIPNRNVPLLDGLAAWKEKAQKSVADYAFHMAVTWWGDQTAREMAHCVEHEGIPSFKTFMAYKGAVGVDDTELVEVMRTAKDLGAMVSAHCEHGDLVLQLQQKLFDEGLTTPKYHAQSRPSYVEGEATHRAIVLAGAVGCPVYIVHVTAKESLEAIIKARNNGQTVFGETCPQYLLLDDSVYETEDFKGAAYVMSPPIRPREGHQESLWNALKSGQIQTVATDHCPFNLKGQKELGKNDFRMIPNGAGGIQHRLALMYTYGVLENRISLKQFVEVTCTRPAQLFGMYPRKGSITVGADADLVVWNPETEGVISAATHYHRCDSNIFEGFKTKGAPTWVVANGKVQFEEGDLKVERGAGRYIPRQKGQSI